jgi:hypothetical protein
MPHGPKNTFKKSLETTCHNWNETIFKIDDKHKFQTNMTTKFIY